MVANDLVFVKMFVQMRFIIADGNSSYLSYVRYSNISDFDISATEITILISRITFIKTGVKTLTLVVGDETPSKNRSNRRFTPRNEG